MSTTTECATGKKDVCFEDILELCCGFGRWQVLIIGLLSVMWLVLPAFSMSMMFVGATPDFKCADGFDENATFASLPPETPRCRQLNSTAACSRWVFDRSVYESTVVTEWSLVCDRKPLLSMLQSWLMLGAIIGSPLSGQIADHFGRRVAFLPAMTMSVGCAFAAAMIPDYFSFAVLRFFTGLTMGIMVGGNVVLAMELAGCKQRAMVGNLTPMPFAVGTGLLGALSYAIRTRWQLQLAYAAPFLILLLNFCALPESPRWLVFQGRLEDAYDVLLKGARCNRRKMPPRDEVLKLMANARHGFMARQAALKDSKDKDKTHLALQLFYAPKVRRNTLTSVFVCFVVGGSFYGIMFNTKQLSENPHLTVVLNASLELLSYLSFPVLDRFGRRRPLAVFLLVPAAAMMLVFSKEDPTLWLVLGIVAKLGVTAVFTDILFFTLEFTPTQLRGLACGLCQTAVRLGAAASPFVVDLLSERHELAPSAVFGACVLLAGLAVLTLPETLGRPMPETVADVEEPPAVSDAAGDQGHGNPTFRMEGDRC